MAARFSRTGSGISSATNKRIAYASSEVSLKSGFALWRITCLLQRCIKDACAPCPVRLAKLAIEWHRGLPEELSRARRLPRTVASAMCTVPTGFSSLPPPGPAIPVTPKPMRAAHPPPNSIGQRHSHFRAHRALGGDQLRRHVGPGSFAFIAVAHYAAKEKTGAAGDAGESLRKQSAGAAFRYRNGRIIQRQFASHDFVQGLTIARKNPVGQGNIESALNLVECFLSLIRLIAPQAQMNLDLARRTDRTVVCTSS